MTDVDAITSFDLKAMVQGVAAFWPVVAESCTEAKTALAGIDVIRGEAPEPTYRATPSERLYSAIGPQGRITLHDASTRASLSLAEAAAAASKLEGLGLVQVIVKNDGTIFVRRPL